MVRKSSFRMVINAEERAAIAELAKRLRRTRSDAVRIVVDEKVRELREQEAREQAREEGYDRKNK